ncbi:rod shape-determining protein MreC [Cellulophaga omnivescoria]|uniref:rod shape-determining protein MreC n=1 Tax=Cellulophaga omnivescoria TaxID=1888890 RepID=UPI0022F0D85D|nr:rod shape-determining protein MreC [Cellulophaga omnivescoria]WBU90152.1 rod shape-determining protein MreC [Cellulophaga omnivescoria]
MQQIINFLIKNKNGLLYVFLLLIALGFTVQANSYHQSKFLNSSSWLTGNIYQTSTNISTYFSLQKENNTLLEENKRLRNLLFNKNIVAPDSIKTDSSSTYNIVTANVIKNSYSLSKNYITINAGKNQNIKEDMGVITSNGILGIVDHTSNNFSLVQSILNTKSTINAKLKNEAYFGSLTWDTKDFNTAQLTDIPRLVKLKIGDTVVTGASSSIFPKDIPIGVIKNYSLKKSENVYHINISLFQDMANIKNVYIIKNKDIVEIKELEKKIK